MNKTIATIMFAAASVAAYCTEAVAQDVQAETKIIREITEKRDTLKIDYVSSYHSGIWDNWYVSASGGANLLIAEEDYLMPFGQRLAPFGKVNLGREIFPELTLSLGVGYGRMNGWNTGAPGLYKWKAIWSESDPVREYYESQGIDCSNGYKQSLEFVQVSFDIMLNIRNILHNNSISANKVDFYGLLGPEYFGLLNRNGYYKTHKVGFRAGAIANFNLNERFAITSSLIGMLSNATFDNEIGKGHRLDGVVGLSAGIVWKLGKQGYHVERLITSNQYALMADMVTRVKEEYDQFVSVDAIINNEAVDDAESSLLAPSIVFDDNKDTYSEELQMVNVFRIAQFLGQNPELKLLIIGNTESCDKGLARRRAELVRKALIEKYGIESSRLKVVLQNVNTEYKVSTYGQTVNFGALKIF